MLACAMRGEPGVALPAGQALYRDTQAESGQRPRPAASV